MGKSCNESLVRVKTQSQPDMVEHVLNSTLRRQSQVHLYKFKTSLLQSELQDSQGYTNTARKSPKQTNKQASKQANHQHQKTIRR